MRQKGPVKHENEKRTARSGGDAGGVRRTAARPVPIPTPN